MLCHTCQVTLEVMCKKLHPSAIYWMLKVSQIIVWLVERKVAFQPPVLDGSLLTNILSVSGEGQCLNLVNP